MPNPTVTQEEESDGQSYNNVYENDGDGRELYYSDGDDDVGVPIPEQVSTTYPTLLSMLTAEFDCDSLLPRLEKWKNGSRSWSPVRMR